jgi:transcriptional regulator with XRE-family HTH domain
MKPQNEVGIHVQQEARQLIGIVRVMACTLGVSNAALARKANVPLANLVRYFRGDGEPKVEFLLAVVRALGLDPREFFELVYPELPAPTASRVKIEKILHPLRLSAAPESPAPEPETGLLQREDIERILEQLRQDVRELVSQQMKESGTPPWKNARGS